MSAATTAAVSAEKEWGQWTGSLEVLHMQDAGLCRETKHLWLLNVKVCHAFLQNLCYRSTKDLLVWSVCSNTTHLFQGLEDFFLAYDGAKKKKKNVSTFSFLHLAFSFYIGENEGKVSPERIGPGIILMVLTPQQQINILNQVHFNAFTKQWLE